MKRENGAYKTVCVVAVAVAVLLNAGVWAAEGKAQTTKHTDYVAELNKLGMVGRAESDNAAPFYQKAFELYVKFSEQQAYPTTKGWPADLPEKELSALRNWVQANSQAFSQLELGSKKPYCWFRLSSPDGSLFQVLMPLAEYRTLCFAITERAKLASAGGNTDKAIADIVTCYRFGLHIQTGGPKILVEQLVGIAVRMRAVQTAFDILDRTKVDKDLLSNLQSQVEELPTVESYVPDFRAEKYSMLDIIQRIFTDDGKGDGQVDLQSAKKVLKLDDAKVLVLIGGRGRRQMNDETEKMYEYLDKVVRKTPWQQKADKIDLSAEVAKITKGNLLLSTNCPAVVRVGEIFSRCKADIDGLITTLALLRYKADKGQVPENLDELVKSGYIKTLASDPFSRKPFVYRRIGENFTLYSFGENLKDDEGKVGLDTKGQLKKWVDNGDTVFWPVLRSEGTTADTVTRPQTGASAQRTAGAGATADRPAGGPVAVSASNLTAIGRACWLYAKDYTGKLPANLQELVEKAKLPARSLESPLRSADFKGPSYIYVLGQTTSEPPGNIVAYENPEYCTDGLNVLYMDTHVGWRKRDVFLRELEATYKRLGRKMPEIKFAPATVGEPTQPSDKQEAVQKPAQRQPRAAPPTRSTRRRR